MQEGAIRELDDGDLEFASLLNRLGVKRNVAKLITFLAAAGGESTSREIEHGCGMRQPEVSIAMRTLRRESWVSEREVRRGEGKGRPHKSYTLVTPIDEIVARLEDERQKQSHETMENIQRLKDLAPTAGRVGE
ncbi:ArsR family transcriptional regulator [Candidatus Methanocrinis natronophilus]|uniref:ArsR family transcriptional regulator n=1 Tax=Candidatus Methanocrinis natronophilus TaxID=3033396 RepID=A0ABT5XB36_9EURY|nr:ArsR family transcriptional regulator [Candidatus Methanocrinis natronophilus]MDF0591893.1 ArsR family transcriptional regulator [Candidatus Methanocrinis natronophilus]